MTTAQAKLKRGIDALAETVPYGHLLACIDFEELFLSVARRIAELQAEVDNLKECPCETCRHFHANIYTCNICWAPLECVYNDYSEWEAMIPRVTDNSTEAEFDAESANSTTKIT